MKYLISTKMDVKLYVDTDDLTISDFNIYADSIVSYDVLNEKTEGKILVSEDERLLIDKVLSQLR